MSIFAQVNIPDLTQRLLKRDRRAIAQAITVVENDMPAMQELLAAISPRLGGAYRIGITGPPGAGKSTLTSAMTKELRRRGLTRLVYNYRNNFPKCVFLYRGFLAQK